MPGLKIRKGDRVRKSQRPTRTTQQGGIIDKDMPLPVSNVALICPSCGKPTRVGFKIDASGAKVRLCKKCGGEIT
jgi:large subunit ribosomal protein L24